MLSDVMGREKSLPDFRYGTVACQKIFIIVRKEWIAMVIGIFGESCTGKSSIAEELRKTLGARIVTGKDYLKLSKSEAEAERLFSEQLVAALTGAEHIIYVLTEQELLKFLPEGCFRVRVTAGLERIKERFAARMKGNLPAPVAAMLEKEHGMFDPVSCDISIDSDTVPIEEAVERICKALKA